MTLFEFIALVKRNLLWVLLTSFLVGIASYLYIAPKEDRVTLLIKCYPNDQYKKEITHIATAIHDLFKKNRTINTNYEAIDEFIELHKIQAVKHTTSSSDTLNIWFKLIFEDNTTEYIEISNKFIAIANDIIREHSILSEHFSDKSEELLLPLFPEKPYTDVSLSTITPWKGALLVFILSFIFAALLFAVIEDIKKHRSSSIH